ncbi:HEAT repeat domain-containing protein [Micromonospora soli]|uniref:HEAT repeat domain-containing protein n=1 Tax=Micromonospora sp. NBRC 110009 TaxID=3061627 RepID=UPI002673058F|nr:HEAT repeat domain-containing protein [Micromonospora sp. NBRC 110009]WKT96009.1 HEAT repeat domain-containing protein [Micromonospora sp. NBRC 110009]
MPLADLFRYADGTLDGDPWPLVRELAVSGDRSAAASVQAALERHARERNWYGRDLMAHVLAGLSGAEVFPLLLRVFAGALRGEDDEDGERLGRALSAVMRADRAGCRAVILPALAGDDPDLRRAALWALRDVFEPSDMGTLREALADPDPAIRRIAVSSLPSVAEDPQAYELVVATLQDPDDWVRHHAVLLLAWSAPPAVVDHLVPLTSDPSWYVRSALGQAIGRMAANSDRAPAAATALRKLLADSESAVRSHAATGLGLLGESLDALQSTTDDPDWWVRAAVTNALAANLRRWPPARPLLAQLTRDENPTVRETAKKALHASE